MRGSSPGLQGHTVEGPLASQVPALNFAVCGSGCSRQLRMPLLPPECQAHRTAVASTSTTSPAGGLPWADPAGPRVP